MMSCELQLEAVRRICPHYHLFGHIHSAYGVKKMGDTTFVNGAYEPESRKNLNTKELFKQFK
jgi:Icc-related predicted phosphoesterase